MARRVKPEDLGPLMYERRLAEIEGNDAMVENLDKLLKRLQEQIKEQKKLDEEKGRS